jgi:hypothetical protein
MIDPQLAHKVILVMGAKHGSGGCDCVSALRTGALADWAAAVRRWWLEDAAVIQW